MNATAQTPYLYVPITFFDGKVLKCAGIATKTSEAIVRAKHPTTIVTDNYLGDRIYSDDLSPYTGP